MDAVRGLFWTICTKNSTVFLLGSIHCMQEDMYPLPATMEHAFSASSVIVFEADIEETRTPTFKRYVQAHGTYPPGDTLWDHISPSTQDRVRNRLSLHHIPVSLAERIRPWLLSTMVNEAPQDVDAAPHHATVGIDAYFLKRARSEGKQAKFLERATAQVDYYATLPAPQQEFLLLDALRDAPPEGELSLEEILALWNAGEADALEAQYRHHHTHQMVVYEHLVIHRNHQWMPQLEEFLRLDEEVMIVVGGGHVGGPDGVVRLLTDKGYSCVQT